MGVVIILQNVKDAVDGISGLLQPANLFLDFRHGEQHFHQFGGALLQDLCGLPVKGEGRGGGNKGDVQLHRHRFAPDCHGIGNDAVGLQLLHMGAYHTVQRQRSVGEHPCGKGEILSQTGSVVGRKVQFGIKGVAGYIGGACGLDFLPKKVVGVVPDLMPPGYQFFHDSQRGVGVAVGRDAEKDDFIHRMPSF